MIMIIIINHPQSEREQNILTGREGDKKEYLDKICTFYDKKYRKKVHFFVFDEMYIEVSSELSPYSPIILFQLTA